MAPTAPTRSAPGWVLSWLRFAPGPATSADAAPRVPGWQRALGGALVTLGAVELALLEVFLVPLRAGATPVPVAVLLAVAGNVALTRLMYRATIHRGAAALPVVAWLLLVLLFAAKRPEGDLVVPGTGMGLAFLLLGTVTGAFAIGQVIAPRPPAPPARRPTRDVDGGLAGQGML